MLNGPPPPCWIKIIFDEVIEESSVVLEAVCKGEKKKKKNSHTWTKQIQSQKEIVFERDAARLPAFYYPLRTIQTCLLGQYLPKFDDRFVIHNLAKWAFGSFKFLDLLESVVFAEVRGV